MYDESETNSGQTESGCYVEKIDILRRLETDRSFLDAAMKKLRLKVEVF